MGVVLPTAQVPCGLPHPTPCTDPSRTSAWMIFQAFLSPTLFSVLYSRSPSFRSCLAFSFTWQMRGNTTGWLRPGHWLSSLTHTRPAGDAGTVFLDGEGKWLRVGPSGLLQTGLQDLLANGSPGLV